MDIKPAHLRTLQEVARTGTLAAAAESLGYTPSAISQQMTALASAAGHQLLEPAGRGVQLTDAGRILVRHTQRVLGAIEEARAAMDASLEQAVGDLHVGVFESFASAILPELLDVIDRTHPGLRVCARQMDPIDATKAVADGTLDAAFVPDFAFEASASGVQRDHICRDWFRIVVADDDPIRGDRVALTELRGRELIGEAYVFPACRQAGFEPMIRHHLHDYPAVLRLVAGGQVIALVPDLALAAHRAGVRSVDPLPDLSRDIQLVTRPTSAGRPGIGVLAACAIQAATELGLDTSLAVAHEPG